MEAGDLCFTQLAELRHRGAFSTVAQTFAAVCQQCSISRTDATRQLTRRWYQASQSVKRKLMTSTNEVKSTLCLINEKGSVITRRSAGIPALIVGVLMADPSNHMFTTAMEDLQGIAKFQSRELDDQVTHSPQVHALNCLKLILNTPKLAARSDQHILQILEVASTCLGSDM